MLVDPASLGQHGPDEDIKKIGINRQQRAHRGRARCSELEAARGHVRSFAAMMAIRELEILLRLEDAERRGETPRARGGLGSRFRQALPQQMQFVLAGRLRTDPRQSRTPSSQYAQASQLCLTLQQDRCLRVQPTPTGPPATDLVKRPRAGPLAATAADLRPIRADRAPPVLLCASPAGCADFRVQPAPPRRREFRCVAVITSPLTPGPGYDSEVGEGCIVGRSREGHGKASPADMKVLARLCGHSPRQAENSSTVW